jgi:peptidoglycan hydrolase CwlO-like protein
LRQRRGKPIVVNIVLNTLLSVLLVLTPPAPSPEALLQQNLTQYQQLANDLSVTTAQIDVIQRQIDGLKRQVAERRALVGRLASTSYRTYRADSINAVLQARNLGEVRERMLVLNAFAQYRKIEIKDLQLSTQRFASAQRTLDALLTQQHHQQQELIAQKIKLEAQVAALRAKRP